MKKFNKKSKQVKIYMLAGNRAVLQAYNPGPTLRACNSFLKPFLEVEKPIGHTHYRGSKEGFITSYLMRVDKGTLEQVVKKNGFTPEIRQAKKQSFREFADFHYNIFFTQIELGKLNNEFRDIQRDDVVEFCASEAKTFDNKKNNITIVDKIAPNPRFTLKKPFSYELVKYGKGTTTDSCVLDVGFDFSLGCLSNISPDWYYNPEERCSYCYAYQSGPCFLDTLFDIDEKELIAMAEEKIKKIGIQDKKTINFRIGQTTEAWIPKKFRDLPGFKDNLVMALEAFIKMQEDYSKKGQKINVVMPSKTVKYDARSSYDLHLASLFKRLGVSVFASVAYEELEAGINSHEFTPEKRLQEILKLSAAGVNSNIYIATDLSRPLSEMQEDAKMALEFFYKHRGSLGLQFLDIRITKTKDAKLVGGESWNSLKDTFQQDIFLKNRNWHLTRQGYLAVNFVHDDYRKLARQNKGIRICYTHSLTGNNLCGNCFMDRS